MLKIERVDVIDDRMLDIELNNGHLILFDMHQLMIENQNFASLGNHEVLEKPKTDGFQIIWSDGQNLSLKRILALLEGDN
jgi:hypothetical protein